MFFLSPAGNPWRARRHQSRLAQREPRPFRITAEIDLREHRETSRARQRLNPLQHLRHRMLRGQYSQTIDGGIGTHGDLAQPLEAMGLERDISRGAA
jgi:hypothetical protein